MYDFLPNFLEPKHFSSNHAEHHYIEVSYSSDEASPVADPSCTIGSLTEHELASWLAGGSVLEKDQSLFAKKGRTEADNRWQLRVLFSPAQRDPGLSNQPFSFSQAAYNKIVEAFQIPPGYLTFLASHTSIDTAFELDDGAYGMLANMSEHGLALVHHPKLRLTVCYVVGLCEHQIERCQTEVQKLAVHGHDPMLLPAVWLDVFVETRMRRSTARRDAICQIHQRTGQHWSVINREGHSPKMDFEEVLSALNVLESEISWDETALACLGAIKDLIARLHQRERSCIDASARVGRSKNSSFIATKLVDSEAVIQNLSREARFHANQVAMQRSAFNNLISQRDNQLAIRTARDIRAIAEATRADNAVMRTIAEDSRIVALSARHDGSEMRKMAIMSMMFLPGMFVANLCSTSFFDLGPRTHSNDRPYVSKLIWIYLVVTICLTAIVIGVWYLLADRKSVPSNIEAPTTIDYAQRASELSPSPSIPCSFAETNCTKVAKALVGTGKQQQNDFLPPSKVVFKNSIEAEMACACCACPV